MFANRLPLNRTLPVIFLTTVLSWSTCHNCIYGQPDFSTSTGQPKKHKMVYIGYVGRKMIKPHQASDFVIEVYEISPALIGQLTRFRFSSRRFDSKFLKKQQSLLASAKDSCRLYKVNSQLKYRYFYPQGLKKGMMVPEDEFLQWDFTDPLGFDKPAETAERKHDSLPALSQVTETEPGPAETNQPENKNPDTVNPAAGMSIIQYIVSGTRTYVFNPWDIDANIVSNMPYTSAFDSFADSLYSHISEYSDYLGAQRIRLELFDQPFAAAFYAGIYIHYVDSIVNILKMNPLIKPGDYENFIIYTSEQVTTRFKYGANVLLWQGIRRDLLDCDNTAYMVYDIGKKLGFEISVICVPGHALVTAGDFVYETTQKEYYPRDQLNVHYPFIYMNSPDPKMIHAFLSIHEIAIGLIRKNQCRKAEGFRKILTKYFPGMEKPF